jgi:hypothetical protein
VSGCIAEPVSWPQLELYALGEVSSAQAQRIARHLAACPACRECLARIDAGGVQPAAAAPLSGAAVPTRRPQRHGPSRLPLYASATLGALALAAAAVIVLRSAQEPTPAGRADVVKGGRWDLELVRVAADGKWLEPQKFAEGDRFKLLLSCSPPDGIELRVLVFQGDDVLEPLPPERLEHCGNRRNLRGALQFDGDRPVHVCVVSASPEREQEVARARDPSQLPVPSACAVVEPE